MTIGSVLKNAADYVAHGIVLIYYFLYYLVKGRENEGQQEICGGCGEKPTWPPQQLDASGTTNVCCLHGVQNRPVGGFGGGGYPPSRIPAPAPRGFNMAVSGAEKWGEAAADGSRPRRWLSWLNPKSWFSWWWPKSDRGAAAAPAPSWKPFVMDGAPNEYSSFASSSGYSNSKRTSEISSSSWFSKLTGYLWSLFGKKKTSRGEYEESESEQRHPPPIATRRILRVVATTVTNGSGSDPQQEGGGQTDLIRQLKHAIEPHYPAAALSSSHYDHDQATSAEPFRPTVTVRPSPFAPPPAPSHIPVMKIGNQQQHHQHTGALKIHVESKLPSYAAAGNQAGGPTPPAIWSPSGSSAAERPTVQQQPHAATTSQVQTQLQRLRKTTSATTTTTTSNGTVDWAPNSLGNTFELDESQKTVRDIRRQWPPPSNATGVEVEKDLLLPVGASNTEVDDASYQRPVTVTMSPRAFSNQLQHQQQKTGEYEEPQKTGPADKYRQFSQELTNSSTDPSSAGKGVEMFLRRRQRVETVTTSNNSNTYDNNNGQESFTPSPAQRMVPVAAPRKRLASNEFAAKEAVTRNNQQQQHYWQQQQQPATEMTLASSPPRRADQFEPRLQQSPASVPANNWQRSQQQPQERLFSPTPFNYHHQSAPAPSRDRLFTPPPRSHEPKVQQHAYRSVSVLGDRMEQKELIDWSKGPDTTTTVVSATTPSSTRTVKKSTFVASRGSHYTKTSTINALPRTWKSYSEAYGQR